MRSERYAHREFRTCAPHTQLNRDKVHYRGPTLTNMRLEVVLKAESGSLPHSKLVLAVMTDKIQMLEIFAPFSFKNLPRNSTLSANCRSLVKDASLSGDPNGLLKASNRGREALS